MEERGGWVRRQCESADTQTRTQMRGKGRTEERKGGGETTEGKEDTGRLDWIRVEQEWSTGRVKDQDEDRARARRESRGFEDERRAKGTHTGRGRSRNAVRVAPRIGRAEEPVRVQVNEVLVSAAGLTRARYGCVEQKREEEEAKKYISKLFCCGERRHGQVVEVTDGVTGAIGRLPNGFGREYLEPRASASGPSRTGFTSKTWAWVPVGNFGQGFDWSFFLGSISYETLQSSYK
ncbi:hypothetical protein B0H13DRAFT_1929295 [Mycena leptocephala]|nr:hypothetical protein B0H13DRAFT_1929295 [Mycena leptocephala]